MNEKLLVKTFEAPSTLPRQLTEGNDASRIEWTDATCLQHYLGN